MSKENAIVTGGACGIGKCITKTLLKNGKAVIVVDKNKQALKDLIEEFSGFPLKTFCADLSKECEINDFINFVNESFEGVDYVINNACISNKGILSNCDYNAFNDVLKVGVVAPYYLTYKLKDKLIKGGSIVNIASTRAFMSQEDTESYTAAKGGIIALTHALAVSLKGLVRVNSISPGWIDTGECYDKNYTPNYSIQDETQHLSGRVGIPQDIANAVMFLIDKNNSFINGENITVDGGMTKTMIYHGDDGWTYKLSSK